ncbi:pyridoxal phosphate-dependent decarboxylase family protein [Psychromicrobium sp. YIM B11713]|uniref:pyridoxal phosphate-dependent decarboxylase family protein n=1 Tax=Psychromicrobium sp. YIM B11713 TaxID=3145233 RepID=UPI00374F5181
MPGSSAHQSTLDPTEASTSYRVAAEEVDVTDHLFQQRTSSGYLSSVIQAATMVAEKIAQTDRPFTGRSPRQVQEVVDRVDLDQPLHSLEPALEELKDTYLRDAVYFHPPRYAAHLNCPVVIPALAGETVLSALNSSMDTWDQSAGATLIERKLIDWTAARLGLGEQSDGVFTSGGSQSNQQALLMARNHAVAGVREKYDAGLPGFEGEAPRLPLILDRFRIFASELAHFSVQKSASMLGLGYDSVVPIKVDAEQRLDLAALRQALAECEAAGLQAMAVVGTAGTTDFGSIDPLPGIAELAEHYDAWFHVDAAYGGGLITSVKHRDCLSGIELADSITVDYHKTFFQPVSSSAVLVRSRESLSYVTYYADYLNPASAARAEIPNQVDKSIQTTRRFDALKLWLTLRVLGAEGVGAMIDRIVELSHQVYRLLQDDPEFEVVAEPALSTLVFRYLPRPEGPSSSSPAAFWSGSQLDRLNQQIRARLFASGEAVVAGTVFKGAAYLKFTLLNPEASAADLRAVIELLRGHGRTLSHAASLNSSTEPSASPTDSAPVSKES